MNELIEKEMGHGAIVKKGEKLLIEVELLKDMDVWENDAVLLQSIFEEKPIMGEFRVTNLFFEQDARTMLLQHLRHARQYLDEMEKKIMLGEQDDEAEPRDVNYFDV